jgi:hypothetical protein
MFSVLLESNRVLPPNICNNELPVINLEKYSSLCVKCIIIQTIRSTEINRVLYLDVTIKDSDLFLRAGMCHGA